jgi:hypothetical protein
MLTHDLKSTSIGTLEAIPHTTLLRLLPFNLVGMINQGDLGIQELFGIVALLCSSSNRLFGIFLSTDSA